jgi:hypothetical protein
MGSLPRFGKEIGAFSLAVTYSGTTGSGDSGLDGKNRRTDFWGVR